MKTPPSILISNDGMTATGLWTEAINLHALGTCHVERASTIEFNNATQQWDVAIPVGGPVVFSHSSRQWCLEWEHDYFNLWPNDLCQPPHTTTSSTPTSATASLAISRPATGITRSLRASAKRLLRRSSEA